MTSEPPLPGLPPDPREFRRGLSEGGLVEGPAVDTFAWLGWETKDLWGEWAGGRSSEGRESRREVVLALLRQLGDLVLALGDSRETASTSAVARMASTSIVPTLTERRRGKPAPTFYRPGVTPRSWIRTTG